MMMKNLIGLKLNGKLSVNSGKIFLLDFLKKTFLINFLFQLCRDKNNDGYMDNEEVKDWIIPPDFDHAEAEARHLIYEADSDVDEKLTKDEILEKYDLFVGSQATDFGEALTRHDEF